MVYSKDTQKLIEELYEPPTKKGCFAYCAETDSCKVCTDLICSQPNKKCPFFKTKATIKQKQSDSAEILLEKMKTDRNLRRRLKLLGITESDLREKIVPKGVSE